jgi:hypothetical protein
MVIKPKSMKSVGIVGCLLLLMTLPGCAPKLVGVWRDPGFTPPQISSARFVLGGIGSSVPLNDDELDFSGTLDRIFWKQMEKKAPGLALLPLEFCRENLGADQHAAMIAKFAQKGELTPKEAMSLTGAVGDQPTFVIYGRLVEDRTDSKSIYETTGLKIDYKRRMAFSFAIYEIATGKPMWSGGLTLIREDRVSEGEESAVDSFGDLVASIALQMLLPPVQKPISTEEMVKDIFGEFAKQLVEEQ